MAAYNGQTNNIAIIPLNKITDFDAPLDNYSGVKNNIHTDFRIMIGQPEPVEVILEAVLNDFALLVEAPIIAQAWANYRGTINNISQDYLGLQFAQNYQEYNPADFRGVLNSIIVDSFLGLQSAEAYPRYYNDIKLQGQLYPRVNGRSRYGGTW